MQSLLIRWAMFLALALPVHSALAASSDFNGDGNSDIVWRQVSTGRAILYLMNGGTLLSSLELGGNTDWSAVATGDFNGDGKADILWRQASTGNVLQNLMNTGTVLASTVLGGNTDWVVAGVADLNGDGKSDILWRQVSTGRVIMYLMNGGSVLSTFDLGGNTDWNPVATGDFNGDGKGDILWRQVSTGRVMMYLMNGGSLLSAIDLGGNTDWNPVATGDFNGDGKSDILWRQVSTGKVLQYQMNGGTVLNAFELGGNTDWNPVATGDFNGDGKADILWGQVSTGSVVLYLLNGPTILSTAALGGNTDWGITGQTGNSAPVLQSIAVIPAGPSLAAGLTQQFVATGTFSNSTSVALSAGVTWTSSNTAVATVNASGLAVAVAAGTATITAMSGALFGSTALTVAAPKVDDVLATCPTLAEIQQIDRDLALDFSDDPTRGTIVCRASEGSADLTLLQRRTYKALLVMRDHLSFDAPLAWTSQAIYQWLVRAIRGIRFRNDIGASFCCDPAGIINIRTTVGTAQLGDVWGRWPSTRGFVALIVHEARHNEGYPHTCGALDNTISELGAWGVQYHFGASLIDRLVTPSFFTPRNGDPVLPQICGIDTGAACYRDEAIRATQNVCQNQFCHDTCP